MNVKIAANVAKRHERREFARSRGLDLARVLTKFWWNESKVELLQRLGRRCLRKLARRGVLGLEVNALARRNPERRLESVVPAMMDMIAMNRVLGVAVHRWVPRRRQ